MAAINPFEGRLLLEVFEELYGEKPTLFAAQAPVAEWHGLFEDTAAADTALDRVVHNVCRIELQGPPLRASIGAATRPPNSGGEVERGCEPQQRAGERTQSQW